MPNLIVAQMIVAFISFFIIYTAVNKSIKYDFRVDDNDNDWIENEHYAWKREQMTRFLRNEIE